jgi:transposase
LKDTQFWLPNLNQSKVMNYSGIDVSKVTLDVTVYNLKKESFYSKFTNNNKGHKELLSWLKANGADDTETLFCMENTGLYSRGLSLYLTSRSVKVWVVMPIMIKRSIGLQRGKNDKVDSLRIAQFAMKHYNDQEGSQQDSAAILELKDWLACRSRLIRQQLQLQQPINEFAAMGLTAQAKAMRIALSPALTGMLKSIKKVEQHIRTLIRNEQDLKKTHTLMVSVPGIGDITAWHLIAYSNGMKNFNNAKQLACYCGVAPFEHSSGSSIRGKTRVSQMANKQLKSLLHLGALTIIGCKKGEMYNYYERKVNEGKSKMNVINALRNKILQRVVSVVKNDQPYQSKVAA